MRKSWRVLVLVAAAVVALRFILFPVTLPQPPIPAGVTLPSRALPPPPGKLLLPPSTTTTTPKPVDIFFYDIQDPLFHLVDSRLTDEEVDHIASEVTQLYLDATKGRVQFRFHKRKLVLEPDRSRAFLYYLYGSPKVKQTSKKTNLVYGRSTAQWVVGAFSQEIDEMIDAVVALGADSAAMQSLQRALARSPQRRLTREEYTAAAVGGKEDYALAFHALVGTPDGQFVTQSAFADFQFDSRKSIDTVKFRLAFRLFYLHCGLSVDDQNQFLGVLQDNPMFLLHYAIGRDKSFPVVGDLKRDNVNRPPWEFINTISLLPTYYYHDLNGRGGKNWMDVVFRTASCWAEQNKLFEHRGKQFGPVMCRWGVRDHERHRYQPAEFVRLIAHEVGHCLGLIHNVVYCQHFASADEANLMQQHGTVALKEWARECRCTGRRCLNCECPFSDAVYGEVAKARRLEPEQVELAVELASALDYLEADAAPGCLRIGLPMTGGSAARWQQPLESAGLLLNAGEAVEIVNWWSSGSGGGRGKVRVVRFKPFYVYPVLRSVRLRVYTFSSSGQHQQQQHHREVFVERRIDAGEGPHTELDLFEGLDFNPGDGLGIELCREGNEDKARIRFSAHHHQQQEASSWSTYQVRTAGGARQVHSQALGINFDMCEEEEEA